MTTGILFEEQGLLVRVRLHLTNCSESLFVKRLEKRAEKNVMRVNKGKCKDGNFHIAWLCVLGSGLAMILVSSSSVLFFCPAGSPSGLPEIIGYLNGTSMQHLFNIKTFLGTFVSCVLAVASGLFCGPEGPMIHLGAIMGCGLSQLQSDTLGIHLPFFTRFRNSADKNGRGSCHYISQGTLVEVLIDHLTLGKEGALPSTFSKVEITNDVQSLLLIMLAVMVAKMVGDSFNASLYSSLLKLKCIPYLDVEPFVRHRKKWLNLELFSARDVMEPRVRVLHLKENVASLARLLRSTSHGGFPVVYRSKPDHAEVFQGTIKRLELCMLLENEHLFEPETNYELFSSSHALSYQKNDFSMNEEMM
nr:PREDICTED: chloride channel protein B-like [Struthio camelus australis]